MLHYLTTVVSVYRLDVAIVGCSVRTCALQCACHAYGVVVVVSRCRVQHACSCTPSVFVQNIKLSDAVQKLPRQVTCNVHGVGGTFLDVGRTLAVAPQPRFTKVGVALGLCTAASICLR